MVKNNRYVLVSRTSGNKVGSTISRKAARTVKKLLAFDPMIVDTTKGMVIR